MINIKNDCTFFYYNRGLAWRIKNTHMNMFDNKTSTSSCQNSQWSVYMYNEPSEFMEARFFYIYTHTHIYGLVRKNRKQITSANLIPSSYPMFSTIQRWLNYWFGFWKPRGKTQKTYQFTKPQYWNYWRSEKSMIARCILLREERTHVQIIK